MATFGQARTPHGHPIGEVSSALQKAIRRGDHEMAVWWAFELDAAGYGEYAWKRMRIICSEDIGIANPSAPAQIRALYDNWLDAQRAIKRNKGLVKGSGAPLFMAHAAIFLAMSPKSRMVDWAVIWTKRRADNPAIPDEALDMHTGRGRRMGRGVDHFLDEASRLFDPIGDDPYESKAKEAMRRQPQPNDPANPPTNTLQLDVDDSGDNDPEVGDE